MDPRTIRTALLVVWMPAAWTSPAVAQVTAVLTADNHYGLYYAAADGSDLTFIGRNEMGTTGDPGDYNWILPETYTFDVPEGDHLYVVAWDEDAGSLCAWIGDFTLPDGSLLPSDTVSWECLCGSGPCPMSGDVPADDVLIGDISAGGFVPPGWSTPNGTGAWSGYAGGLIAGIGPEANFIWYDDAPVTGTGSCLDHYVIFRTVAPIGAGSPASFSRGDSDASGAVDLTDAIALLQRLYLGGSALPCEDAADADDNGSLELTDAVVILGYMYLGEPPPAPPGPMSCGPDPTGDAISCGSFPPCR